MRLVILTTRYPYAGHRETYFETEFQTIAFRFEDVHILPLYGGEAPPSVPASVTVWPPLRFAGRWFIAAQLLRPATWSRLAEVIAQCSRMAGLSLSRLKSCIQAACIRTAFEEHRGLSALLESPRPVTVYSYWGGRPALFIPLAKAKGARTVVRYHNIDLYCERDDNDGFIPWRDEIQSNVDLNVFVSQHGLDYFNNHAGPTVVGKRIVARLGSPDFGPPRPRVSALNRKQSMILVSVSHIVSVKRVHLILRLAKALAKSRHVEWHHFGSGSYPAFSVELARGIPDTLKVVLAGSTSWSKIQMFYRENPVTLFVNLSEYEGIPVSIMEALNADIPVLASDACGTSEAVIDGQSGMLVGIEDCEDSEALAATVLVALEPGGLIASCAPRSTWSRSYDGMANADAFTALLRCVASQ